MILADENIPSFVIKTWLEAGLEALDSSILGDGYDQED